MATEVTVKIWQRNINQALLVDEKEWGIKLSELRDLLTIQGLEVPNDYRFLTCSGNIVSTTLEQTIEFKDILTSTAPLTSSQRKTESDGTLKAEELNEQLKNGLKFAGQICLFQTDGTPDPLHHCACSMNIPGSLSASPSGPSHGIENENLNIGQEQPQDPLASKVNEECHGCPALMLKNCCPFLYDALKPKRLLKALLILPIILIVLMAALTLTLHMIFGITGSLSHNAGFSSFLTKPSESDSEMWINMKVRLSEIEMANKFEIQDVKRKISELEDLYLRDLEVQRRELTLIKNRQVDGESTYGQKLENMSARLDKLILMMNGFDRLNENFIDQAFKEDGEKEKLNKDHAERNGSEKRKNGNQKKKGN
ncbi:unnamed protein product [Lymnaea stagnalis]|uniref:Uncharacterized protein n=1 Tax=Lymnaea stagnalis TaxID=6523 RepID=A0AAV2I654_LYMST